MNRHFNDYFYNRIPSHHLLTYLSKAIADHGVNNRSVASALADYIDTSQRIQGQGSPCKRRACRDARSSDRSKFVSIQEDYQSGRQKGVQGDRPLERESLQEIFWLKMEP